MRKSKTYNQVQFSADVLKEASTVFKQQVDPEEQHTVYSLLRVTVDHAEWTHDTIEEFFADYRRVTGDSHYVVETQDSDGSPGRKLELLLYYTWSDSRIKIWAIVNVVASSRLHIEAVFEIFERSLEDSRVSEPPQKETTVFIGHGNSNVWKDLKDHLHEQHNYDVMAYEIGSRAGHQIRDILEQMLDDSSFAILVMTGEDRTEDGDLQPRMNVVHELGLFQGSLGFNRSIALVEAGTKVFSNINGVQQIRFSEGNIREAFGDVLATLAREFPAEDGSSRQRLS